MDRKRSKGKRYAFKRYSEVRREIVSLLGSKCAHCGIEDKRVLQIDHVNGGGKKERNKFGRNLKKYYLYILNKIKNGSTDYQVLCANCNWIKRFENNE